MRFVVVVFVVWLFVAPFVIFVDRPGTRLSADASALVSVLFAYGSAYPVPVLVVAFHPKPIAPRGQDPL